MTSPPGAPSSDSDYLKLICPLAKRCRLERLAASPRLVRCHLESGETCQLRGLATNDDLCRVHFSPKMYLDLGEKLKGS